MYALPTDTRIQFCTGNFQYLYQGWTSLSTIYVCSHFHYIPHDTSCVLQADCKLHSQKSGCHEAKNCTDVTITSSTWIAVNIADPIEKLGLASEASI